MTTTKSAMVAKALDTHIRTLQRAVDYGLGTQPDNSVELRWEASKAELKAYTLLRAGNAASAKRYMAEAERLRWIANGGG